MICAGALYCFVNSHSVSAGSCCRPAQFNLGAGTAMRNHRESIAPQNLSILMLLSIKLLIINH